MKKLVLGAIVVLFAWAGIAQAAPIVIDLANNPSGTANGGVLFTVNQLQATGTGIINPFLRVQANGTESGYNTSVNNPPLDDKAGIWTHDLLLSAVPLVNVGGNWYREFGLDVNQTNSAAGGYDLSVDKLSVYLGTAGGWNAATWDAAKVAGTEVWTMGDYYVWLNYDLNPGSGAGDMYMYIPEGLFAGAGPYVYLYSQFGLNYVSNDGFEEWFVQTPETVVPEPATMMLLGTGLVGLGRYARRRRR